MKDDARTSRASTSTSTGDEVAPRDSREHASGRVAFDSRGDAVWQWRADDGRFRSDASTTRVQKLLPQELALEPTQRVPIPQRPTDAEKTLPCGGYDPYDRSTGRSTGPPPKAPAPGVPRIKYPPVVAPPPPGGLLERLRRWLGAHRR